MRTVQEKAAIFETPKARPNPHRVAWLAQRRDLRVRAARAVHWIHDAADVPRGFVHSPRRLAHALLAAIVTPTVTIIGGHRCVRTDDDAETIASVRGYGSSIRRCFTWGAWQRRQRAATRFELVVPDGEPTLRDFAWGVAALAFNALETYCYDSFCRHFALSAIGWPEFRHRLTHAISDRLLGLWEAGGEQ